MTSKKKKTEHYIVYEEREYYPNGVLFNDFDEAKDSYEYEKKIGCKVCLAKVILKNY